MIYFSRRVLTRQIRRQYGCNLGLRRWKQEDQPLEIKMNLKQIKDEALHLPEEERAELAQKLLLSLDIPSQDEIEADWLTEAHRRARELDEGIVQPISVEEVRRKAQALLR